MATEAPRTTTVPISSWPGAPGRGQPARWLSHTPWIQRKRERERERRKEREKENRGPHSCVLPGWRLVRLGSLLPYLVVYAPGRTTNFFFPYLPFLSFSLFLSLSLTGGDYFHTNICIKIPKWYLVVDTSQMGNKNIVKNRTDRISPQDSNAEQATGLFSFILFQKI